MGRRERECGVKKKKKMRERERVINAFSKAVPSLLPQQSVNEDSCFCVSSSLFVSIFSTKIFCWKSQKATFSSSSPRVWFLGLSVVGKRQRISVHNLFLSLSLSFCLLNNSAFFFLLGSRGRGRKWREEQNLRWVSSWFFNSCLCYIYVSSDSLHEFEF